MLENAVLFAVYRQFETYLKQDQRELALPQVLQAGSFAGFGASIVLTPVELIKCRMQVQKLQNPGATLLKSTFRMFLDTLRLDRLSFFRGFHYTAIRETGGGAAWFGTYEFLCRRFRLYNGTDELYPTQLLVAGACAGIMYNGLMYPIDVVKSIAQTSTMKVSFRTIVSGVLKSQGPSGFYRGVGVTVLRAIPGNATIFYVYESALKLWNSQE